MNYKQYSEKIASGGFDDKFQYLYSDPQSQKDRYSEAIDEFIKLYPNHENDEIRIFSAPGRTEIGGNHTDHQHGVVLAGSVELDVIAIVALNNDNTVRIKSKGYNMDVLDISDLDKKEKESGKAISLIRGIMYALDNKGYNIGGFDAYTTSNVVKGSGLSSSAAFEVLVSGIFNYLFNDSKIGFVEIAKISQFAEREYFDKPCGLLDQMASASGGIIFADFNSPEDPIVEKMDFDVSKYGYKLCVVNTGGNHADLTDDYADITKECKLVSNALDVEYLRDARESDFYGNIADIRNKAGDRAVLRAHHFFSEEKRVFAAKKVICEGNIDSFFDAVKESGISSACYLQNLYSVSNVKEQGLMLAIALTEKSLAGKGAYRVHGGGFAGTIQAYVPDDMIRTYKEEIENAFGKGSLFVLKIRPTGFYEM